MSSFPGLSPRAIHFLIIPVFLSMSSALMAQTATEVHADSSYGTPVAQLFFNAGVSAERGQHAHYGYYIDRAHFGYRYVFNSRWRAEVILDAGKPTVLSESTDGTEGSDLTMTLKFANIEWKPTDNVAIQAGSILQNHYITQERYWGLRFIDKTFQDRYFGIPSADLGVIGYYSPVETATFDAAVTNGNGFRHVQDESSTLRIAGGATWSPGKAILRAYYASDEKETEQSRFTTQYISGFAGYTFFPWLHAGVDLNYAENYSMQDACVYGGSLFALIDVSAKSEVFVRWDNVQTRDDNGMLSSLRGDALLAGYALRINTLLRTGVHYRLWQPRSNADIESHECLLSIEMKM